MPELFDPTNPVNNSTGFLERVVHENDQNDFLTYLLQIYQQFKPKT